MTVGNIAFLGLVFASMIVFAAVVGWATKQTDSVPRR